MVVWNIGADTRLFAADSRGHYPVKQTAFQNLLPRTGSVIDLWITTRFFNPSNSENVTWVARRMELFRGFLAIFLVSDLPPKKSFNSQEFIRFLSIGVGTFLSHALWRVLSNKVIWVLGHCWVDTPHILTFKGESLFICISRDLIWKGSAIWQFLQCCFLNKLHWLCLGAAVSVPRNLQKIWFTNFHTKELRLRNLIEYEIKSRVEIRRYAASRTPATHPTLYKCANELHGRFPAFSER